MSQDSLDEVETNLDLSSETLRQIDIQISHRMYENIIDYCISVLNKNLYTSNKDMLYQLIEKITLICDKTHNVAEKIVNHIALTLLNHNDVWINTEIMIILEKISKYTPNILSILIEPIISSLKHYDKGIREICLNIIGNLILSIEGSNTELIYALIKTLNDDEWKIRARALEIIKEIIISKKKIEQSIPDLELIQLISDKIEDEDEEVRNASIEILHAIKTFINPDVFFNILEQLIEDVNWEICEKGIWLVGETGKEEFNQYIEKIIPKLIGLLENCNLMVQTKIIDAFVKIGRKYPHKIMNIVVENLDENEEKYNALFDIFLYLSIENFNDVFPFVYENLNRSNAKSNIIHNFFKDLLLKIYEEVPEKVEAYIAKILSSFHDIDWRIRLKNITLLGILNMILKAESIAVWSDIKLKELLETEIDPEVIVAIKNAIEQVNSAVDSIEIQIREIDQETNLFYQQMMALQNLPTTLKTKLLKILEKNEFREASISLEEEINAAIKKIESFGQNIYNYRYKRLAVDLLEDWSFSRLELLEQLSDLKAEIQEKIELLREKYLTQLKDKISNIKIRIDVLKSELDYLMEFSNQIKDLVSRDDSEQARKKLEYLAYIRDKIYRLESEIGTLWIENLDFKEELRDITVYWVQVKIETQQILYAISYNLRDLHQIIEKLNSDQLDTSKREIKKDLSFELLLNEFQTLILQSTKNIQEQFERFSIITSPISDELKKGNYDTAENLLELMINQTKANIEDFNKEIQNIFIQLDSISTSDLEKSKLIRKYLQDWEEIKDSILERGNEFYENTLQEIFLKRIVELQKIINPIPIKAIAKKIKQNEDLVFERLFKLIDSGILSGKIKDDKLYLPEAVHPYDKTLYVSRKFEVVGSNIYLMVRLENKSRVFIHDIDLILSWPKFLDLIQKDSENKFLEIEDFQPEEIRIFQWIFKISKPEKESDATSYLHGEIKLLIRYKDIFDVPIELDKRLDILIR